jgi:acyl-coenzyme A thioesterase PaaI-like protein
MSDKSLQEKYAPSNACWGCGPANPEGLRIRSFPKDSDESRAGGLPAVASAQAGEVVAEWQPEKKYEAFEGVLNGGVIGTLLDCHCNWTAAYHLMKRANEDHPPCTVTAEYAIKLLRPTPTNGSVFLSAKVVDLSDDRATIEGALTAGGKVCATCRGVFVAVKEGHPAYHRW